MAKPSRWALLALAAVTLLNTPKPLQAAAAPKRSLGEQKVLVVMARFPDVAPSVSVEALKAKYFTRLDRYVRSISNGKTWVTGKATAWYTLPQPVARYSISAHNLEVDKGRVTQLICDALNLADADEDLSSYSMVFLSLGARRKDYGMAGLCGYPGMLGWQAELPLKTEKRKQTIPGGVAIFSEEAHVGVVFHDMAHILGGTEGKRRVVPCLYDHDLQGKPGPFRDYAQFYLVHLGYFDPMSCHMYQHDQPPPGICAWTKLRLGWVDKEAVAEVPRGASRTIVLAPLSGPGAGIQVIKLPLDETTYYLIENRQAIGPDAGLPAHGVLISSCDATVAECRRGASPVKLVNANPSVPELKGAPFRPGAKDTYQDARRGVTVRILAQKGDSYELAVSNGK
jgi:hypothetical protein